jgi:PIN domain nuclease of toxin-antitoxin system
VNLLLDTRALLWWLEGAQRLTESATAAIGDPQSRVFVSAVTVWEIEIKRALRKLVSPDDLLAQLEAIPVELLSVTAEHAVTAGRLPRHHDDPFDRMLIAQAVAEALTLVTRDPRFSSYGVAILPA